MKRISNRVGLAVASVVFSALLPQSAQALFVDTILADAPAGLSGTVTMTVSGNQLTIVLVNTSAAGSAGAANGLLTGVAFSLPSNYLINSGNGVVTAGSTIVGLSGGESQVSNIQGEWGFQNANVPGHFGALAVNRVISTLQADTTALLGNGTSVYPPGNINGPEMGLLRAGGDAGGLHAISSSITFTLTLSSSVAPGQVAGFLAAVDTGTVALTFGSPTSVPDAGSALALLGIGLASLSWFANRRTGSI